MAAPRSCWEPFRRAQRNAQVALYQSGDVDFLVATDAIGMGLNMDVDHVAFAATRKFDGRMVRDLSPAELAQIAGRAGRHMNDGTFGVTGEAEPFSAHTIEQLEMHNFEPARALHWRNRNLDFSSLDRLANSLNYAPGLEGLTRTTHAEDAAALDFLSRDPEIQELAGNDETVQLLWDVCQVPDYRNITSGDHANLIGRVFRYIADGQTIPNDWFSRQVSYADDTQGDIDALSNRIAHIRTWTYIANKPGWLADPVEWQQRTRAIEDKLSDALHERLAQRFIDRRTSVLMKRLREKEDLMSAISQDGEISVEGQFVGHLKGFHFVPDTATDNAQGRALRSASMKAVAAEISSRAQTFATVNDSAIELSPQAGITWQGARIARLQTGESILKPRTQLIADDQLTGTDRQLVQERIERWVEVQIDSHLGPLRELSSGDGLEGLTRGIAFQLVEGLGILARDDVADDVKSLDQPARATLRKRGVRFGAFHIFLPALLKPAATRLKLVLWALQRERDAELDLETVPEPPQQGLTSAPADPSVPAGYYHAIGYRVCGSRAVRVDMLERLSDLIRPRVYWKPEQEGDERPVGSVEGGGFTVIPDMMSLVGCSGEEFSNILSALGFRVERRRVKAPKMPAAAAPCTPEAQTSEPAASPEPVSALPATVADDGASPDATVPQDAAPEELIVEIWRPKARPRPGSDERKRDARRQPRGANAKRSKRDGGNKQRRGAKPAPAAPVVDANSPFAALGALRDALTEKQPADG